MPYRFFKALIFFSITGLVWSCSEVPIPRPYGYFRVDLPNPVYRKIDTLNLPYRFDLPESVKIISCKAIKNDNWIDLYYPKLNATIYCSYKPVNGNLIDLLEDSRKMVYKHSIRADGIGEKAFDNPKKNVHG